MCTFKNEYLLDALRSILNFHIFGNFSNSKAQIQSVAQLIYMYKAFDYLS